jgi:hypothetical protein
VVKTIASRIALRSPAAVLAFAAPGPAGAQTAAEPDGDGQTLQDLYQTALKECGKPIV